MTTVLLIRHGRSTANRDGVLAGRNAGVALTEDGVQQALAAGARLKDLALAGIITSPLERCVETTARLRQGLNAEVVVGREERLIECDYGSWSGRKLAELGKEPLWADVRIRPSTVTFPDGESFEQLNHRVVSAIHALDRRMHETAGENAVWAAVTHADVIKLALADAMGLQLDQFQRLHVDQASVSVVRYGSHGTEVIAVNTTSGDLAHLGAKPGATVGGADA